MNIIYVCICILFWIHLRKLIILKKKGKKIINSTISYPANFFLSLLVNICKFTQI